MATLFQFNPFHIRGETYMANIHWGLACLLLFVPAAVAQEHYTEGPVWRVTLVRVKPAQMDAYLTSLRQATKPLLEEEKRTGAIVDYKIFLKETNSGPQDWDLALAVQYKNHAAMDGLTAKGEAVRDKIMGGKQQAQQVAEKRQEIREVVSSELLQEIMLKCALSSEMTKSPLGSSAWAGLFQLPLSTTELRSRWKTASDMD